MNKDTFCSLPFTEIFLGPDNAVKPCCSNNSALGLLSNNTIQEILQNKKSLSLRQSILNNEWHPSCIQCQRQESQGVRSERENNLERFIQQYGPNIDNKFFKLTRLDLRWSNVCNLSCTYCYEYFSSKWANIKGIKINTIKDENEQSLFLLIEQQKNSVENILMLGGEPLLQKQNIKLIELLSRKNFYILTNLSVPFETNNVAKKLLKEDFLQIGVSFETIKNRYEYVRHGADWKIFNENLDYIKKIRNNIKIDSHSLYSIYSAFNLVEFYEYIEEKNIFNNVLWNFLESSGENIHASVFKLTNDLKEKAVMEIENVTKNFSGLPGVDDLTSIKENLIKSFNSDMLPKNQEFIQEAETVDRLLNKEKGKKFSDLWSDLYRDLLNNK